MKDKDGNYITTKAAFDIYDKANPIVYEKFKTEAFRARNKRKGGRKRTHYSSKRILEWIRHECAMRIISDDEFKINNNFTPWYARKFVLEFPDFKDFFEFREIRAAGDIDPLKIKPAVNTVEQMRDEGFLY